MYNQVCSSIPGWCSHVHAFIKAKAPLNVSNYLFSPNSSQSHKSLCGLIILAATTAVVLGATVCIFRRIFCNKTPTSATPPPSNSPTLSAWGSSSASSSSSSSPSAPSAALGSAHAPPSREIKNKRYNSLKLGYVIDWSEIESQFLFVSYDNYAFDIRDIVALMEFWPNYNPYKNGESDTRLYKSVNSADFARLMDFESQALGSTIILNTVIKYQARETRKALELLRSQLSEVTIRELKLLGTVCSLEHDSSRKVLNRAEPSHWLLIQFLDKHKIGATWDNYHIRAMALKQMQLLIIGLPKPEQDAICHAWISRYYSNPTRGDIQFGYALHEAISGYFCVEHMGTGIARLCMALEELVL